MALQPDTYAAIPDPDDPTRTTYWAIGADGVVRDFPLGIRWRPTPPSFPGVDPTERSVQRQQWYDRTYFPWRRAVAAAIEADPVAAEAAFHDRYPDPASVPMASAPKNRRAPQMRRQPVRSIREALTRDATTDAQALIAYALHADGHSHAAIAQALGTSEATARRRVLLGRGLLLVDEVTREQRGLDPRPAVGQFVAAFTRLLELQDDGDDRYGVRGAISAVIARRSGPSPATDPS